MNRLWVFTSEEERTPGKSAVDEGNLAPTACAERRRQTLLCSLPPLGLSGRRGFDPDVSQERVSSETGSSNEGVVVRMRERP